MSATSMVQSKGGMLRKIKFATGLQSNHPDDGKGRGKTRKRVIVHGFAVAKGRTNHPMEDYLVADLLQINNHELGLFAIFDGHLGNQVPAYLQTHLISNILSQPEFWNHPPAAIMKAYHATDKTILHNSVDLGLGGSTAVTAILIDGARLIVANVGDSRAVLCRNGYAIQLSVDHDPKLEQAAIEQRGGFVGTVPGDVPRVDGQLAVARAFGDKRLKLHLSCEPDILDMSISKTDEFLILASDGVWKVMENQDAVNLLRKVENCEVAAKMLTDAALARKSTDDISCIVVRFK